MADLYDEVSKSTSLLQQHNTTTTPACDQLLQTEALPMQALYQMSAGAGAAQNQSLGMGLLQGQNALLYQQLAAQQHLAAQQQQHLAVSAAAAQHNQNSIMLATSAPSLNHIENDKMKDETNSAEYDLQLSIQQQLAAAAAAHNQIGPQIGPLPPTSSANGVVQAVGIVNAGVTQPDPSTSSGPEGPKRLHVSNIPFRFRDPDLKTMFEKYGPVSDVEIIFNERGSKGFGFVTMERPADAEKARQELHGSMIEGRKVEVNCATARVHSKKVKPPTGILDTMNPLVAQTALAAQAHMNRALLLRSPLVAQSLLARGTGLIPGLQQPNAAAAAALQLQAALAANPLAQLQGQPLMLNAAALQTGALQQAGAFGLDQASLQAAILANEQARLQFAAAAAAQGAATSGASLGEQYLGNALSAATLPTYPINPAYRTINRFTPY